MRVVIDPLPRLRYPDAIEHLDGALVCLLLGDGLVVSADHLRDLPPDPVQRVQAGQRVLKDHRDLGPADPAQGRGLQGQQIRPVEHGTPGDLAARSQPEQRLGQDGLTAAGLADDADRLPGIDAE